MQGQWKQRTCLGQLAFKIMFRAVLFEYSVFNSLSFQATITYLKYSEKQEHLNGHYNL